MDKDDEELVLLRNILARELETINDYQSLLGRAQKPEVIEFISHIIDEEKEHVAEAMELINRLDPKQAALFQSGHHWAGASALPSSGGGPITPESASVENERKLTVGSLRASKQV